MDINKEINKYIFGELPDEYSEDHHVSTVVSEPYVPDRSRTNKGNNHYVKSQHEYIVADPAETEKLGWFKQAWEKDE